MALGHVSLVKKSGRSLLQVQQNMRRNQQGRSVRMLNLTGCELVAAHVCTSTGMLPAYSSSSSSASHTLLKRTYALVSWIDLYRAKGSLFEVAKADASPKALLIKAILDLCSQVVKHACIHLLDLAAPLSAGHHCTILQLKRVAFMHSLWTRIECKAGQLH